mgnify:CR=1 FL=1
MRILVLSDSHSTLSFMRRTIDAVRPDSIIHLGDHFDDGMAMHEELQKLGGGLVFGENSIVVPKQILEDKGQAFYIDAELCGRYPDRISRLYSEVPDRIYQTFFDGKLRFNRCKLVVFGVSGSWYLIDRIVYP